LTILAKCTAISSLPGVADVSYNGSLRGPEEEAFPLFYELCER
jgi:hypothetical protein